jgi:hypothetical protein
MRKRIEKCGRNGDTMRMALPFHWEIDVPGKEIFRKRVK